MAKARKKKQAVVSGIMGPTDEQFGRAGYERASLAYRRIAVIRTLHTTGKLSDRQYDGLSRYRDIGIKCERSDIMDSCQRLLHIAGGMSDGPAPSTLRALTELGWLERELGSLSDIARAIAIDDVTVSEWAMRHGGSVMREREGPARKIIRWFEPRRKLLASAMLDIRMAGERLAAAIGA